MAFDVVQVAADTAVKTNGTLTFSYLAGKTADSYAQTAGAMLALPSLQAVLPQGAGAFSLAYGASSVVATYLGTNPIPAGSAAILLQMPLVDLVPATLGGAAAQANTDAPLPITDYVTGPLSVFNLPQTDVIDFGAFPGTTDMTYVVQGQGNIKATSVVDAWVVASATADHSVDEHWMDPPDIVAGNIVPGVGFTIYGKARQTGTDTLSYGKWSIGWQWF